MIRKKFRSISVWQFEQFSNFPNIIHFITEREGGKSSSPYNSLNLSFKVGDREEDVRANREILSDNLGISTRQLIFPSQTHGNQVKRITELHEDLNLASTDGLITNKREIAIAIMAADCVPVFLYDTQKQVIAAIHAGWRGTVAKIISKTITTMRKAYGTNPQNIIAGIGPSISQASYEVGKEVVREITTQFPDTSTIIQHKGEKGYLNLWEANKYLLLEAGVPEKVIEIAGICTYNEHQTFFSARRNNENTGRFAAGIMIRA